MKILVTGAKGFVGRNLCSQLNNIKEGKASLYKDVQVDNVFEYDLGDTKEELDYYCAEADFVFNLAGVNRPQNQEEFMKGNLGFATTLLDTLKAHKNACPVMLSSSVQASLTGRFGGSEYGRSKKAGEELFFQYGHEVGARMLIYRFPNLFGKWCRPNYNSAIATFCNNIANDLPIQVNDRNVEMELLYIDDLVDEMISALVGKEHRCEFEGLEVIPAVEGHYCYCPVTHKTTLGEIVDIISECAASVSPAGGKAQTALALPQGSLEYKLMTTYLSYLPKEKVIIDLKMNVDQRGSFTELIHTLNNGQVSINISQIQIEKSDVIQDISAELENAKLPPEALIVELTESALLEDNSNARHFLKELRKAGIRLALDDFGTGYSNFHYLNELRPDIIKIDRSFTAKAIKDAKEYDLLKRFCTMIHRLNIKICIEGVETEDEWEKIRLMDPDYSQGYLWGKPCSFDELLTSLIL